MCKSQRNNLKSGITNSTEVNISSNVIGNSNDEINFPHKLLLTNTKFRGFVKLAQIDHQLINKLSKAQLYKIGQSGRFLGKLLG